jgi:hypothetical protein
VRPRVFPLPSGGGGVAAVTGAGLAAAAAATGLALRAGAYLWFLGAGQLDTTLPARLDAGTRRITISNTRPGNFLSSAAAQYHSARRR